MSLIKQIQALSKTKNYRIACISNLETTFGHSNLVFVIGDIGRIFGKTFTFNDIKTLITTKYIYQYEVVQYMSFEWQWLYVL